MTVPDEVRVYPFPSHAAIRNIHERRKREFLEECVKAYPLVEDILAAVPDTLTVSFEQADGIESVFDRKENVAFERIFGKVVL